VRLVVVASDGGRPLTVVRESTTATAASVTATAATTVARFESQTHFASQPLTLDEICWATF